MSLLSRRCVRMTLLVCVGLSLAVPAAADSPPKVYEVTPLGTVQVKPPEKREVPDFDGRDEETTFGDVAIWFPRVALYPLYFLTESIIRKPLHAGLTWIEKENVVAIVVDFFTYEVGDSVVTVFPIFNFDTQLNTTGGLSIGVRNLGAKGHNFSTSFSLGTQKIYRASIGSQYIWDPHFGFTWGASYEQRPDLPFAGIGSRTDNSVRGRYEWTNIVGSAQVAWYPVGNLSSEVSTTTRVRYVDFRDRSVAETVDELGQDLPPGFEEGYLAYSQGFRFLYDSRPARPAPTTGIRLSAPLEFGVDVREPSDFNWIRYGLKAGFYLDLTGTHRVLGIVAELALIDPMTAGAEVPFTEFVQLGGAGSMPAFSVGRLIDRSAATLTAEYRWPIWTYLDGSIQATVGEVYGGRFDDFEVGALRGSFSFGMDLVTNFPWEADLNILVAFGTTPFDEEFGIDSIRFVLETDSGF